MSRSRWPSAAVTDLALVIAFVLIGRRGHVDPVSLTGFATTAWPFLSGLAVGWLASRAWRRPLALSVTGVPVWGSTVVVGMLLRAVSDQGTAGSFIVVASIVLAVFLLGWRGATRMWWRHGRDEADQESTGVSAAETRTIPSP